MNDKEIHDKFKNAIKIARDGYELSSRVNINYREYIWEFGIMTNKTMYNLYVTSMGNKVIFKL